MNVITSFVASQPRWLLGLAVVFAFFVLIFLALRYLPFLLPVRRKFRFYWNQRNYWARRWEKGLRVAKAFVGGAALLVFLGSLVYWVTEASLPEILPLEARTRLRNEYWRTFAGIAGGLITLAGLGIAWRRVEAAMLTAKAAEEGNLTERFTRAIDQLGAQNNIDGHPHVVVRLGGIYALEQIAKETPKYYWAIVAVLSSYVRESAPIGVEQRREKQEDVHAALLAVFKILKIRAPLGPNISPTVFSKTHLPVVRFYQTVLDDVDFRQSNLEKAGFRLARMRRVDFSSANLVGADFRWAQLEEIDFSSANLEKCNFQWTKFIYSMHSVSEDDYEEISGGKFGGAILTDADMRSVDLRNTEGLTKEQLLTARIDELTKFPKGTMGITKEILETWTPEQCRAAGLDLGDEPEEGK